MISERLNNCHRIQKSRGKEIYFNNNTKYSSKNSILIENEFSAKIIAYIEIMPN